MTTGNDHDDDPEEQPIETLDAQTFRRALETIGEPVATTARIARALEARNAETAAALESLAEGGLIESMAVDGRTIWYPTEFAAFAEAERVITFPDRHELVVEDPEQFTRAQLSQFARLVDSSGEGAYIYEIRAEDVWWAPYDHLDELLGTMRSVLPERFPDLENWIESQWSRARRFALVTHPDGYTVLEAESPELMGNVARQKLDTDQLHAPISETESWVIEGKESEIKRRLYEAGYPVQDRRDLEVGDPLELSLSLSLREYQRDWVDRFLETGSGVLVGPPGSGKTVAAIAALAEVGGETLILVPSRELAGQWHEQLLVRTDLAEDRIGEYHGGEKSISPVTIATYRTAGMDRHRTLFEERRWGLIIYDEVHHVPAAIYRRSADLQAKRRLGLSVSGDTIVPIRRGDTVTMERIDEFVEDGLDDPVGVASVEGVETIGVTEDGRVVWTPVTSVMCHENDSQMYTVRASNGRQVTVTEDHSLMVFDASTDSIESKRPLELTEDDYLIQPTDVPFSDDKPGTINVLDLLEEGYVLVASNAPASVFDPLYERGIGTNRDRYNWTDRGALPLAVARRIGIDPAFLKGVYRRKRTQYVPPVVSIEDLARLVGLFVADGALDENRVEFYATDSARKTEVGAFEEIVRAVVPEATVSKIANGENCTTLRVSGPLVRIFEALGLSNGAREKSMPEFVLSNPQAHEPFLEGVVLGDGHRQERSRNRSMITVSTSSSRLVQELDFVLAAGGFVGGSYRRRTTVGVRPGSHDTVENTLVRYNPANAEKTPRNAMVPFTDGLRESFDAIERVPREQRWAGTEDDTVGSGLADRSRLNSAELRMVLDRSGREDVDWLRDLDVAFLDVESVTEAADEDYVYDLSTGTESFLGDHLFCHNSATPVREDEHESEIFTLIGPPIGTDWAALFEAGFVAEPEVELRYVGWGNETARNEYASAEGHERRQVAGTNPAKIDAVRELLDDHPDSKALVFVEWLEQGRALAEALEIPFISGETRYAERERLFDAFRRGDRTRLIVSRVGDEGIDLPNAELAIVASGLGGSRRQSTQRAGRTMRPASSARMYVLATRGTREEDFVRRRLQHLVGKGVALSESDASDDTDSSADASREE